MGPGPVGVHGGRDAQLRELRREGVVELADVGLELVAWRARDVERAGLAVAVGDVQGGALERVMAE
jgi:hypothetical protein